MPMPMGMVMMQLTKLVNLMKLNADNVLNEINLIISININNEIIDIIAVDSFNAMRCISGNRNTPKSKLIRNLNKFN